MPHGNNGNGVTHGCTTKTMRERFGCNWSKVGLRVCAREGCDRPSMELFCGPCYEKSLSFIRQLKSYRDWLPGWEVKERQLSSPSLRVCGAWSRGRNVRDG